MAKHVLKQWSISFQAQLGLLLASTFADAYDAVIYDSLIHRVLTEQDVHYNNYALVPGFDYQNADTKLWTVFVRSAGQWNAVTLPNPFYSVAAYSSVQVVLACDAETLQSSAGVF